MSSEPWLSTKSQVGSTCKVTVGAQKEEPFQTRGVYAFTDVCPVCMLGGKILKQIHLYEIRTTVQDQINLFSQPKL